MSKRYLAFGIFLIAFLSGAVLYFRSQTVSDFGPVDTKKAKGDPASPVEIVEYSNFECYSCREVQPFLSGLLEKYPGKIRLVFRHYPGFGDQSSLWSHIAAECAARKGVFWPYHDKLFEHQREWSTSPDPIKYFIQYAKELGLDESRFRDCLQNESVVRKVHEEDDSGIKLGFKTSPTFIVNGEMFVGMKRFMEGAEAKIESELKRQGRSS